MRFTITRHPLSRASTCGHTLAALREGLADIENQNSLQVILDTENANLDSLSANFNALRCWIMWCNENGEWAYPLNPNFHRLEEAAEECFINNGQQDEYSIRWSFSKRAAVKILLHFFEHAEKAPWLLWTDEEYWAQ